MSARAATVCCALLAVDAAAAVAGYEVSATTTVSTRSPLPGDVAVGATTDLQLDPSATGTLAWGRTVLLLRYAPQLIIREPQVAARVLPLHHGVASFTHRFARASLLLSEEASYGVADIGSLRLPAGGRPTGVFEVQTLGAVPYVRSASLLAFDATPDDGVSLFFSAGYLLSGDPTGGLQLPLQFGPVGTASLRLRVDRRLGLLTGAQASHAWFNTGAEQSIALLTETVEWQATRATSLSLGGGVGVTRERVVAMEGGPLPGLFSEVLPVASASVSSSLQPGGTPVQVQLSALLSPFADRFTGLVYERLEGRASATSRLSRQLTASAAAGTGYAIPIGRAQQAGDSATFGEASLRWEPTSWLALVGTGRFVWTEQPRTGQPGQALWAITIAAVVRDRDTTAF